MSLCTDDMLELKLTVVHLVYIYNSLTIELLQYINDTFTSKSLADSSSAYDFCSMCCALCCADVMSALCLLYVRVLHQRDGARIRHTCHLITGSKAS
jgi:hypothetical protein